MILVFCTNLPSLYTYNTCMTSSNISTLALKHSVVPSSLPNPEPSI